jgi:hypothetical protein
MKSLDSLGAILLVSSSIVFDSAGQSNQKTTAKNEERIEKHRITDEGDDGHFINVSETGGQFVKNKITEGTIQATKLFWSAGNNEVYLKGKVRVALGRNNFNGTGSFNFLGPVYLLIVDDKPVVLGSTAELSNQPYRVTVLDSMAASTKYGEEGRQGAVELSVMY